MNILIIGNGFDLAHELPTKYGDFLEFCKMARKIYESEALKLQEYKTVCLDYSKLNVEIQKQLFSVFASRIVHKDIDDNGEIIYTFTTANQKSDELFALIKDNFWIEYLSQCNMHGKENWIDFESEISAVVQSLDNDMHGSDREFGLYDEIEIHLSNDFLDNHSKFEECKTFKEIRDILEKDLNALIRALEIYLTDFVGQIECKSISPDIKEAIEKSDKCLIKETEVHICHVICFNYTDTYEKLYLESSTTKNLIDYIHGKADSNKTVETNNIVLGIDEYLGKKERNKQVEFISFKKFYQRIHKQTGCKYKEWVDKIKADYKDYKNKLNKDTEEYPVHNLYIFGHSLDVTDKDVLRDLILNDNVHTTIFYHNKNVMGQQIANLVKVIGQDELIRRTGGSTKTIEFKQQREMLPIDNQ